MSNNGNAPGIPMAAMKDVKCKCGSPVFEMMYRVKFYPGGLYSSLPVTVPFPVFFCMECGCELQQVPIKPPVL